MNTIPTDLRRRIIARAGDRCEYCGLAQVGQEATFHIDHVYPRARGGATTEANLALACVSCSLRKGDRIEGAVADDEARIFNPRSDVWADHFSWNGTSSLEARTTTGRVTIDILKLNRPSILAIRAEERERGRHPPPVESADIDDGASGTS